uniref:ATP synthase F0 subunit 8 n=1 Tax=Yunnantettix bannaensis TaxID=2708011 RepID=A0A6G6BJS6_9ORTH|nr:ATP synthase F0 subunit 8 [Yunnantettix bannaensis]
MPQMSNLLWLPLMLYFSTIMIMVFSLLFSTTLIYKKYELKMFKPICKPWQW